VSVVDDHDSSSGLRVTVRWSGFATGSNSASQDGNWYGSVGPVRYSGTANTGGTLAVTVTAYDSAGLASNVLDSKVAVNACRASTASSVG
jgi:putative peptide zinc metalloprotease protein